MFTGEIELTFRAVASPATVAAVAAVPAVAPRAAQLEKVIARLDADEKAEKNDLKEALDLANEDKKLVEDEVDDALQGLSMKLDRMNRRMNRLFKNAGMTNVDWDAIDNLLPAENKLPQNTSDNNGRERLEALPETALVTALQAYKIGLRKKPEESKGKEVIAAWLIEQNDFQFTDDEGGEEDEGSEVI